MTVCRRPYALPSRRNFCSLVLRTLGEKEGDTRMHRNRNIWITATAAAALILTAGYACAQAPPGGPGRRGPGGPMELLRFEEGPGHKLVKGAPFSASAPAANTETLT